MALARYGHPLRFYITPHCPQCPPVAALKLRLVPVTAARPAGEGNRRYVKWPSLGPCAQPSALPGRVSRPTRHRLRARVVVVAPGRRSGAARGVVGQWPAASHWSVCPRPPGGFAAARHQLCALGCPSAPQGGSLSPRGGVGLGLGFGAPARGLTGFQAWRPGSQRGAGFVATCSVCGWTTSNFPSRAIRWMRDAVSASDLLYSCLESNTAKAIC